MTSKVMLLFLLSGTFCAGQSAMTAPLEETRPDPANARAPVDCAAQALPESPARDGNPAPCTIAPLAPNISTIDAESPAPNAARVARPLTAKSEFEQFAEDATGLHFLCTAVSYSIRLQPPFHRWSMSQCQPIIFWAREMNC